MNFPMPKAAAISFGLALAGALVVQTAPASLAQSGEGWTVLLDGETMGDWQLAGETNWHAEQGAIVADNRTSENPAYLVSPESYDNFELYVEFWASDDANSGIFFRCLDGASINDMSCYEANIFDTRADPSYGTGAIVRHAEVDPMPKAGGQWNTFEITADGRDVVVVLNGEETARLRSGLFTEGPFALQHGQGTIKFRKVAIRPL